jgi:hypothetical protein
VKTAGLAGIAGRAFVDMEPFLDVSVVPSLDDEICLGLTRLPSEYTGGCHRSMGIMPSLFACEPWADYGEVIAAMSDDEFVVFDSLSDTPGRVEVSKRAEYTFGEEREIPLSRRQMLFLEYKYGVYFPWKVYIELMPGGRWEEKADPEGKRFTKEAMLAFPRTIAFIKTLPFAHIGSVKLLGLASYDHGTVHRDRDPADGKTPDEFITFCPTGTKRLFVWDDTVRTKTHAPSSVYWFNDGDYHGVEADPFFRYSLRVDGVFRDDFRQRLERALGPLR